LARLCNQGRPDWGEARWLMRRFQPYLVNVRRRVLAGYQQQGLVRELPLGLWEWLGSYHEITGIQDRAMDPDLLVV